MLVELHAPPVDWQSSRPPLCVLPVIDVSGSMGGAKLRYAKESAKKLIDHLAPGDFCGLVTFTTDVTVVAPPVEMTVARKTQLKAAIDQLTAEASTNLAGGMLAGLELVNAGRIPQGMPRRVILFTDGLANVGPATAHGDILQLLEASLGQATLSAFGYGHDACHELLRDLSTKGKGNYAFVRNPEDALTAFARELGGLLSTYARDVELQMRPAAGVTLTDVTSDVDSKVLPEGTVQITVPDLLGEEVRQIVLGLSVERVAAPGTMRVLDLAGRYRVVAGETTRTREERFELSVHVQRVPPGEEQVEPTRDVDEAVATAQLVRAQIEAEERARQGDLAGAQQVMSRLQQAAVARGHAVVAEAAERIADAMSDREAYARSSSLRSSMRKGFARPMSGTKDEGVEDLIARSGRRSTSLAQDALVDRFSERKRKAGPTASSLPRKKITKSLERRRSKRW